jgi:hypothetical protein
MCFCSNERYEREVKPPKVSVHAFKRAKVDLEVFHSMQYLRTRSRCSYSARKHFFVVEQFAHISFSGNLVALKRNANSSVATFVQVWEKHAKVFG